MKKKRMVAVQTEDGHIDLIEEDISPVIAGSVLVEVHSSLISPGTELGGWRELQRKLKRPTDSGKFKPFGYSNAGVVLEVGDGVDEFNSGDRIACIGNHYALHANYAVVPHNLCTVLPNQVTFAQGSYAMLAATALHAMRRGSPQFGEYVAVIGLGLLGQLTAMFYQLGGNFVMGWDIISFRTDIAKKWNIDAVAVPGIEDEVAATKRFTNGYGLDTAVIAFSGDANMVINQVYKCLKCSPDTHRMGRIIVVGNVSFTCPSNLANVDICRTARTGPGYHDKIWEFGQDYPPVFMRWTTRTNLEVCMQMIVKNKLKVDSLTTHTIPLENIGTRISSITKEPDKILGVILEMKH